MNGLSNLLQKCASRRATIYVLGDIMVDENYQVQVTRISPESPNCNVMLSPQDRPHARLPGGAANICYLMQHLPADFKLLSWADRDAIEVLNSSGIATDHVTLSSHAVPRKKRFFDGEHQVGNRWDIETPNPYLLPLRTTLAGTLAHLPAPDYIIFSDYHKGMFDQGSGFLTPTAPTLVDPKHGPAAKWYRCNVIKPNSSEAKTLCPNTPSWREQCKFLMEQTYCQSVIITQGGRGVVGRDGENEFEYHPAQHAATNLVGAGDCYIGILALALAHGLPVPDAAEIAFDAAAHYVRQPIRNPLTLNNLRQQSKFIHPEHLLERDYRLVLTNGCFDAGLTAGHIECLRFARRQGDKLVVAVNGDGSVRRLKGPNRPVLPLEERMAILGALEYVDFVVSFDQDTPLELIKMVRPEVVVKGGDYRPEDVAGYGISEIRICPYQNYTSTTEKLKNLNDNTAGNGSCHRSSLA